MPAAFSADAGYDPAARDRLCLRRLGMRTYDRPFRPAAFSAHAVYDLAARDRLGLRRLGMRTCDRTGLGLRRLVLTQVMIALRAIVYASGGSGCARVIDRLGLRRLVLTQFMIALREIV